MRILGTPSASWDTIYGGLVRLGASALFLEDIFPALWWAARRYNVDPLGVIAQAAKETAWGRFGGRIDARWRNTCGLKIRDLSIVPGSSADSDLPLCHASFPSWAIGALAHVQHLIAYSGGWLPEDEIVDPRWVWVAGRHNAVHFADLSGKWAPSSTYGPEIEALAAKIAG